MIEPGLVSIVTAALNGAPYIGDALASVRGQDYPGIEHIVVDGGSTDGTQELLRRVEGISWTSEPDRGQADAINKGFARARGEFVAWLNADDYYFPGAVGAAVRALREHPSAGFAYANYLFVDERTGTEELVRPPRFRLRSHLRRGNMISSPTVFMRRSALDAVGAVDPRLHYAFDYDLWARFAKRFPLVYRDELWAAFRLHATSKTVGSFSRFWEEEEEVLRRHAGRRTVLLPDYRIARFEHRHPYAGRIVARSLRLAELVRRGELRELGRRVRQRAAAANDEARRDEESARATRGQAAP